MAAAEAVVTASDTAAAAAAAVSFRFSAVRWRVRARLLRRLRASSLRLTRGWSAVVAGSFVAIARVFMPRLPHFTGQSARYVTQCNCIVST